MSHSDEYHPISLLHSNIQREWWRQTIILWQREREREGAGGERRVTMLSTGSYVRIESLGGKSGARFFSLALLTPCLKLLLGFES